MEKKRRKPLEALFICIGIAALLIVAFFIYGFFIMRPNPEIPMDSYDHMVRILKRDPDILIIPEDIIPEGADTSYSVLNWSRKRIIRPDGYALWVHDEDYVDIFELQGRDRERTPQFHGHKETPEEIDSANIPLSLYVEDGQYCYHFYTDTHLYTIRINHSSEAFEQNFYDWLNGEA